MEIQKQRGMWWCGFQAKALNFSFLSSCFSLVRDEAQSVTEGRNGTWMWRGLGSCKFGRTWCLFLLLKWHTPVQGRTISSVSASFTTLFGHRCLWDAFQGLTPRFHWSLPLTLLWHLPFHMAIVTLSPCPEWEILQGTSLYGWSMLESSETCIESCLVGEVFIYWTN